MSERHDLGIELCTMSKCESCAYHRKRLAEAVEAAKRRLKTKERRAQ